MESQWIVMLIMITIGDMVTKGLAETITMTFNNEIRLGAALKSHRNRRDITSTCPQPQVKLDTAGKAASSMKIFSPPDGGNYYDMVQMIWTGEKNDTRVIALMHTRGDVNSTIYLSKESANSSNYTYTKATGLDNIKISALERNPTDGKHVLIIGLRGDEYVACVSKNGGSSFTCNTLLEDYTPAGTVLFKDNMVMTIMKSAYMFDDDTVLVLSKDGGSSWNKAEHSVTAALFQPDNDNELIALVTVEESSSFGSGFFSLFNSPKSSMLKKIDISKFPAQVSSSELTALKKKTVTGVQYAGDFLHVVSQDSDGHKVLEISADNGETFKPTHLPLTESGQFINILDTADQLVFAHVTDPTDSTTGTLFTSGSLGMFYSESLVNHVSQDFYKVNSMKGVYLTTQKMSDGSLKTHISLDRGAEWKPIKVKNCHKDDCTLQIYGKYLIEEHKNKHREVLASSPVSSANGRGLIIVQGMIGEKITFDSAKREFAYNKKANVFVSGDGGYSWIMAPESSLQPAPYHLKIEDSGGILQALPYSDGLHSIMFSVDEGSCWFSLKLNTDNLPANFSITGLVTQPGQQALKLGIVGNGASSWAIIDVDFKFVVPHKCNKTDGEDSNYELWDEHPACYLGKKITYNRVKKSSWCHVGSKDDVRSTTESTCACTGKDYECDYGFLKQDDDSCKRDPKFKDEIRYCLDNKVYELVSSGYRLVPGDVCDRERPNSVNRDTHPKHTPTDHLCDEGDAETYLDMETVKLKVCGPDPSTAPTDHHKGLVAATVILSLLTALLCVAFTTYYCRYTRLLKQYEYSSFDNSSWNNQNGTSSSSEGPSISANNESARISSDITGGRSYTKLRDAGAESDVDLLNL